MWTDVAELRGGQAATYFGTSVSCDSTCQFVAIGSPGNNEERGLAYIYTNRDFDGRNIASGWTLHSQISLEPSEPLDGFGTSVALSRDGLVVLVGSTNAYTAGTPSVTGLISSWARATVEDVDWRLVHTLTGYDNLGSTMATNEFGTELVAVAIGVPWDERGHLCQYTRADARSEWAESSCIVHTRDWVVTNVALSTDSNILAAGAFELSHLETCVNIYEAQGAEWVLVGMLMDPDYYIFGSSVSLSRDGQWLAVNGIMSLSLSSPDSVKVYQRQGAGSHEWALMYTVTSSEEEGHPTFAVSTSLSDTGGVLIVGIPLDGVFGAIEDLGDVHIYVSPAR